MHRNYPRALEWARDDAKNDPEGDRAGRSRGIKQKDFDAWCFACGNGLADVKNASDDDIDSIYHLKFWAPHCDDLPAGIDYLFFDTSVTLGRFGAAQLLLPELKMHPSGSIGPMALARTITVGAPEMIKKVTERKVALFSALSARPENGPRLAYWLNRARRVEVRAFSLLEDAPPTRRGKSGYSPIDEDLGS